MCRSRRELSNEYLLAKIGVDTAENESFEVWGKILQYYSFVSLDLIQCFKAQSVIRIDARRVIEREKSTISRVQLTPSEIESTHVKRQISSSYFSSIIRNFFHSDLQRSERAGILESFQLSSHVFALIIWNGNEGTYTRQGRSPPLLARSGDSVRNVRQCFRCRGLTKTRTHEVFVFYSNWQVFVSQGLVTIEQSAF